MLSTPFIGWVPDSTQRVGFFNIGSGSGTNTKKRVGFRSGRSVEIYDRVFLGIFFTVFLGIHEYFRVFLGIYDIISFLGGISEPNITFFLKIEGIV